MVTVASSLPRLPTRKLAFVAAAKAVSSWRTFAASAGYASTLLAVEETAANNWSAVAETTGSTGCFVETVRRREIALAANAGGRSGFAGATIASNFDRVAEESDTKLRAVATAASSSHHAFATRTAERNSMVAETTACMRWVAEVMVASNSSTVVAARVGRMR